MELPKFNPVKPDLTQLVVKPDYFRDFVPHFARVKYEDPIFSTINLVPDMDSDEDKHNRQKASDNISRQLTLLTEGAPDYWSNEEYKGMRPLEIELKILKDIGRNRWDRESKHGLLSYVHGLRAMKLMFPNTDITPSLADVTYISMGMFAHRRKYLHLIGSMDSGKSSSTARLCLLYAAIDQDNFFSIVTTPLADGAYATIMGDIMSLFKECRAENPWLWPEATSAASSKMIAFSKKAKEAHTGWVRWRSLKKSGVARGLKGEEKDKSKGIGLYIADEVNQIEQFENFKCDLPNASMNPYFQMHSTQNPEDESDEGGILCEPVVWGDWGVNTYDEVRKQDLLFWPTKAGLVYRMDGERSVNLTFGKTIYEYLFNVTKYSDTIVNSGEGSPEYWSQIKAMFSGLDANRHLLSRSALNTSNHDSEWWTILNVKGTVMGVDPAKTGLGDEATVICLAWGEVAITLPDGSQTKEVMMWPTRAEESILFKQDASWDDFDLYDRFVELGGDINAIEKNKSVPYTIQVAIRMGELAKEENIKYSNIFFDPTMDEDIIHVRMTLGFDPVGIKLGKPVKEPYSNGFQLKSRNEHSSERCKSIAQECLFLSSEVFTSKKIRTRGYLSKTIYQICNRRILIEKPNKPAEDKKDYKARLGYSPDYGDAFGYAVWGAMNRGFTIDEAYVTDKKTNRDIRDVSRIIRRSRRKLIKR